MKTILSLLFIGVFGSNVAYASFSSWCTLSISKLFKAKTIEEPSFNPKYYNDLVPLKGLSPNFKHVAQIPNPPSTLLENSLVPEYLRTMIQRSTKIDREPEILLTMWEFPRMELKGHRTGVEISLDQHVAGLSLAGGDIFKNIPIFLKNSGRVTSDSLNTHVSGVFPALDYTGGNGNELRVTANDFRNNYYKSLRILMPIQDSSKRRDLNSKHFFGDDRIEGEEVIIEVTKWTDSKSGNTVYLLHHPIFEKRHFKTPYTHRDDSNRPKPSYQAWEDLYAYVLFAKGIAALSDDIGSNLLILQDYHTATTLAHLLNDFTKILYMVYHNVEEPVFVGPTIVPEHGNPGKQTTIEKEYIADSDGVKNISGIDRQPGEVPYDSTGLGREEFRAKLAALSISYKRWIDLDYNPEGDTSIIALMSALNQLNTGLPGGGTSVSPGQAAENKAGNRIFNRFTNTVGVLNGLAPETGNATGLPAMAMSFPVGLDKRFDLKLEIAIEYAKKHGKPEGFIKDLQKLADYRRRRRLAKDVELFNTYLQAKDKLSKGPTIQSLEYRTMKDATHNIKEEICSSQEFIAFAATKKDLGKSLPNDRNELLELFIKEYDFKNVETSDLKSMVITYTQLRQMHSDLDTASDKNPSPEYVKEISAGSLEFIETMNRLETLYSEYVKELGRDYQIFEQGALEIFDNLALQNDFIIKPEDETETSSNDRLTTRELKNIAARYSKFEIQNYLEPFTRVIENTDVYTSEIRGNFNNALMRTLLVVPKKYRSNFYLRPLSFTTKQIKENDSIVWENKFKSKKIVFEMMGFNIDSKGDSYWDMDTVKDSELPPLYVSIARLADQKNPMLTAESLRKYLDGHKEAGTLKTAGRFFIGGPVSPGEGTDSATVFDAIQKDYPNNFVFIPNPITLTDLLPSLLLIAADFNFTWPRFEPCGLTDVEALFKGVALLGATVGGIGPDKIPDAFYFTLPKMQYALLNRYLEYDVKKMFELAKPENEEMLKKYFSNLDNPVDIYKQALASVFPDGLNLDDAKEVESINVSNKVTKQLLDKINQLLRPLEIDLVVENLKNVDTVFSMDGYNSIRSKVVNSISRPGYDWLEGPIANHFTLIQAQSVFSVIIEFNKLLNIPVQLVDKATVEDLLGWIRSMPEPLKQRLQLFVDSYQFMNGGSWNQEFLNNLRNFALSM